MPRHHLNTTQAAIRPNRCLDMTMWPISTRVNKPENDDPLYWIALISFWIDKRLWTGWPRAAANSSWMSRRKCDPAPGRITTAIFSYKTAERLGKSFDYVGLHCRATRPCSVLR